MEKSQDILDLFANKYLQAPEPSLYGLPDGISPSEDLDAEKTHSSYDSHYGTTDSGNTVYDNLSNSLHN